MTTIETVAETSDARARIEIVTMPRLRLQQLRGVSSPSAIYRMRLPC